MQTITANRVHCSSFNTDRFREHMKHVRKSMVPERIESKRIKNSKGLLSLVAKVVDDFFIKPDEKPDDLQVEMDLQDCAKKRKKLY